MICVFFSALALTLYCASPFLRYFYSIRSEQPSGIFSVLLISLGALPGVANSLSSVEFGNEYAMNNVYWFGIESNDARRFLQLPSATCDQLRNENSMSSLCGRHSVVANLFALCR